MTNEKILVIYNELNDKLISRYTHACNGSEMDAEDIVQEAYSRALRYADSMPDKELDRARWFTRIAYNCFIDNRNEQRNAGTVDIDEQGEHIEPDAPCQYSEDVRHLLAFLPNACSTFTEEQSEAMFLHFARDYSLRGLTDLFGKNLKYWHMMAQQVYNRLITIRNNEGYFSGGKWVFINEKVDSYGRP